MSTAARPRLHHIAVTVTDLEKSVRWYEAVFGVQFLMDAPHEGGFGRVLADEGRELMIVLHQHDANDGRSFQETNTGLDHVGFFVPSRADLESWQDHLATQGVRRVDVANEPMSQSPIADENYGSVIVFRDPDNIQLELFCPPVAL